MAKKTLKVKYHPLPAERTKSLIKIQYAITYVDSSIRDPLGRMDPLIYSFDVDGTIVALPRSFYLRMKLEAVEVRDKKSRSKKPLAITPIMFTGDIMDGGQLFHKPYTKAEIKKMKAEEAKRRAEFERDLDDRDYED